MLQFHQKVDQHIVDLPKGRSNHRKLGKVDRDDEGNGQFDRYRKDSFYWFKKVIENEGSDLSVTL